MTRELRVRKATSEDTQTLVNLMEEFYAEADFKLDRKWAADAFLSLIHEDDYGCVWIVSMEEEPIGARGAHCAIHNGTRRLERLY